MSTPAKILIGVLFVLSIVFLVVSAVGYSQRVAWKAEYQNLWKQAQEAKEKFKNRQGTWTTAEKQLRDSVTTAGKAKTDAEGKLAVLAKEKQDVETDLASAKGEIESLTGQMTTLQSSLDDKVREIAQKNTQLETARQEKADAQDDRDEERTERLKLVKLYRDAEQKLSEIEQKLTGAVASLDELNNQVRRVEQETGISITEYSVAPKIDATVMETYPEYNLVMLSVGSDDKVQIGYKFFVYRGDSYVGAMTVNKLWEDSCAGAMIPAEHTDKGLLVEKGDSATTYLGH